MYNEEKALAVQPVCIRLYGVISKLGSVQWVYGAGQPSAKHWTWVLKKIQDAGKCIDISGPPEDLPEIMKYLKGVVYHTYCKSVEDAEDLLKAVTVKPKF